MQSILRYIIVVAVFALAGALGGLLALLIAPNTDSATSGLTVSATAGPGGDQAATAGPATTSAGAEAPSAGPTATGAPTAPAERPTTAATGTAPPAATAASPPASATAAPSPSPTASAAAPGTIIAYTVQAGDLLSFLAIRFNTTVAAIIALNPGLDPDILQVGQVIRIEVGEPEPTATPVG